MREQCVTRFFPTKDRPPGIANAAQLARQGGAAKKVTETNEVATGSVIGHGDAPCKGGSAALAMVRARFIAWSRVLDELAAQREALDFRICYADPGDECLPDDCRSWCRLTSALADFLDARRASA